MKNLFFRRQYILTNKTFGSPEGWNKLVIPSSQGELKLHYHPDLKVDSANDPQKMLVLIGYIIDPYNPDLVDADVLNHLMLCNNFDELVRRTYTLSGRYAILYTDGNVTRMFHDATAFREIYYCFSKNDIFCGATPDIINRYADTGLNKDPDMNEFLISDTYKQLGFWPGWATPYNNIFHLMPNHYLDLDRKGFYRYWPEAKREKFGLKVAGMAMAEILKGTMTAASKRYKLHQALTCGFDTRVLLAASKDFKERVKYFVVQSGKLDDKHTDITVPKLIAGDAKLNFEVFVVGEKIEVDKEFEKIYLHNNIFARKHYLPVFYNDYLKKFDDTYKVAGTFGNEILRLAYPLKKTSVSAFEIAKIFRYEKYPFALREIDNWLNKSRDIFIRNDYNIVNMYFWEQFTANWSNLGASEGAITREEIRPFNTRKLITSYIGLADRHRYKDDPDGHLIMIKILWKDLLKYPLGVYYDMPLYRIKVFLRGLGLERIANAVYTSVKNVVNSGWLKKMK